MKPTIDGDVRQCPHCGDRSGRIASARAIGEGIGSALKVAYRITVMIAAIMIIADLR